MLERDLFRIARERGLTIKRAGCTWRISGAGVSILVTDLRFIGLRDLEPTTSAPDASQRRG